MNNIVKYKSRIKGMHSHLGQNNLKAGYKRIMRRKLRRSFKEVDDEKAPIIGGLYFID